MPELVSILHTSTNVFDAALHQMEPETRTFWLFSFCLFIFKSKEHPRKHTRPLRQTHKTTPINVGSDQRLYN